MESNPFVDLERSTSQATTNEQVMTTPPIGPCAAGTASMFNNARNPYITGGTFSITTNFNTVNGPPWNALHTRAAPNAILNAGGRADEVRCHPGTRKEVLGRIEKWRDAQDRRTPPIFWLSGPAGAGKTAIMQTVAERCKTQGIPQANFFFFRTDTSRNSLSPLVATLVHQIILLYPSLRNSVAAVLSTNPLILDAILEDQLVELIVTPLQAIRQSSLSYLPPLLLIDGLDECESEEKRGQRRILDAFDKVIKKHSCPFRLLVASRDESQIRAAFNNISSHVISLYLDDQYSPENDIRVFVNDEINRIRHTHPLAHTLNAAWPSIAEVEDIIKKSSGQFIYAATVMRFIFDSSASPMLSLARVQGAASQIPTKSPFSYLDAIYTYILSRVNDQETLKDILHAQLLIQDASQSPYRRVTSGLEVELALLLRVYNPKYVHIVIHSCLADLTPIAQYVIDRSGWSQVKHKLHFYHASFVDYLRDQSRSRDYFVDLDSFSFSIQPVVWQGLDLCQKRPGLGLDTIAYNGLFRLRQLPPGFLDTLVALTPSHFDNVASVNIEIADVFKHIYNLCASDNDVTNYKRILRTWINSHWGRRPAAYNLIPYGHRCLAMARIEYDITTELRDDIACALRPESDFDTHETALWLEDLLRRIHREKYHHSVKEYSSLLQQWTSWAVRNDIPLDGVNNLPKARLYLRRSRIKQWVVDHLKSGRQA